MKSDKFLIKNEAKKLNKEIKKLNDIVKDFDIQCEKLNDEICAIEESRKEVRSDITLMKIEYYSKLAKIDVYLFMKLWTKARDKINSKFRKYTENTYYFRDCFLDDFAFRISYLQAYGVDFYDICQQGELNLIVYKENFQNLYLKRGEWEYDGSTKKEYQDIFNRLKYDFEYNLILGTMPF